MKVTFVCNAYIADGKLNCASWIQAILQKMTNSYELNLVSPVFEHSIKETFFGKEIVLHQLPENVNQMVSFFTRLQSDVIVLFGTETTFSRNAVEALRQSGDIHHCLVFAQGFASVCARHYIEGVPQHVVNRITFRDFLRQDSTKQQIRKLIKRSENERFVMQHCKHFAGRTTMDQALLQQSHSEAQYHLCKDVMRDVFYVGEWDYHQCQKHRIFVSQYYYPLKGFHYLLEAASILLKKYPDLSISAAGYHPMKKSITKYELKDSSYILYIKELIKEYHLESCIHFLGVVDDEQMKKEYLNANVFVMPSTIENSPNSLAEAMLLGVPVVAADVGGISDYALHREEAFLYPSSASYLLTYYIEQVFEMGAEAETIGKRGRTRALIEYDVRRNIDDFEKLIQSIANQGMKA